MGQREGAQDEAKDSTALGENELNLCPGHAGTPKALLAPILPDCEEVPQESLQLLKVQCPPLGRCWRGLLELKVNAVNHY